MNIRENMKLYILYVYIRIYLICVYSNYSYRIKVRAHRLAFFLTKYDFEIFCTTKLVILVEARA